MNREQQIEQEIESLYVEKESIRSRRTLKCPKCEKRTALTKWTLIRDHHYVQPYSCTGGDYWTFQEYQIFCPKCEQFSRVYFSEWDKKYEGGSELNNMFEYIKEHSEYFGEQLGTWGDRYHGTIDHIREMNKDK